MRLRQPWLTYLLGDSVIVAALWVLFLGIAIPSVVEAKQPLLSSLAVAGGLAFWLTLYGLAGTYQRIFRKSRTTELTKTLWITISGSILLFALTSQVSAESSAELGMPFLWYSVSQLSLLILWRIGYLTNLKQQIKQRKVGFPTLMVGSNDKAVDLYHELEASRESQGYDFVGFVNIENNSPTKLAPYMPNLGYHYNLPEVIQNQGVEEVIIALESSEHDRLQKLIGLLEDQQVSVKVLPDTYDFITGTVKMNYLFGTALIEVSPWTMPPWQQNLKRVMDIGFSSLVLIAGAPLFLAIMAGIKLSSKGPVIFKQERRGLHSEPFLMYKFRTMCPDAEEAGPQLSSEDDPRVTRFGRFLRQYRLDELPQFVNVIKGNMTLVGPRPERDHFISQIMERAPHYKHLLTVKPGVTSWGQVKFGYAENVDEMVERMKYDLLYIENMSLGMDLKILFFTVYIIFQGRGK